MTITYTVAINCYLVPTPKVKGTKVVGCYYCTPTIKVRVHSAASIPMQQSGKGHSVRVINTLGYMTR